MCAEKSSTRCWRWCSATIRIGTRSGPSEAECWRARSSLCQNSFRKRSAASSRRYSRFCARSSRSSATSRTRGSAWWERSATICCSSSIQSRNVYRAPAGRTCTFFFATTFISWIARKSRWSATNMISTTRGLSTLALSRTAEPVAAPEAVPAGTDRIGSHAGGVHGQCGESAGRHAARRLLRGRAAPDVSHAVRRKSFRAVRAACSARAPARTSFYCSSAMSNSWEHRQRCLCGWKGSAWKRARSRARHAARATRFTTLIVSGSFWTRRRKSPS